MTLVLKRRTVCLHVMLCLICALSADVYAEDLVGTNDNSSAISDYRYSPVGRRDPFAPLVKKIRKDFLKVKRNLGPLEKFELNQFRLVALMIIQGSPRAMVESPDGNSYTVKLGDLMGPNGGVVKQIQAKVVEIDSNTGQRIEKSPDRIVIEEKGVDTYTGRTFKETRYVEM